VATRHYMDTEASRNDLEADAGEWLDRVQDAYREGNYLHIAWATRLCAETPVPLPKWLAKAVQRTIAQLVSGNEVPGLGRHAKLLSRAAQAVTDVETLAQLFYERRTTQKLATRGYVRKRLHGENVYDDVARHFEAAGKLQQSIHRSRSRATVEKQVARARRNLKDPKFRRFIGANFPTRLIEEITRKK
jgi:hypothetical protein